MNSGSETASRRLPRNARPPRKVFAAEFPDYAALSHPQWLAVKDIQSLLSGDEALVLFASGNKETYVFAVTRTAVAAKFIPLGASARIMAVDPKLGRAEALHNAMLTY